MKKFIRIIPKLDIKNGNLIKGINLEGLRILGNPINFANTYYHQGADEIIYHDNVATLYGTNNLGKYIKKTSEKIFIPLTVGGGVRNLNDIEQMLNHGADKVSLNSAAIKNIKLIKKASKIFGRSTIVSNLECIKIKSKYFISSSNGRDLSRIDPCIWAKKLEDNGVGEIILTSVNFEGLGNGFDIALTKKICNNVKVPIIAHGGAGNFNHVLDIIKKTNISGVSISSLFHYKSFMSYKIDKKQIGNYEFLENSKMMPTTNILKKLKLFLTRNNIFVRL